MHIVITMAKKQKISASPPKGEIVLYLEPNGKTALSVKLEGDSLWLTQKQISELFHTERSVITKHLGNIFRSNELDKLSVCAKFAHTAGDGKTYLLYTLFSFLFAIGSMLSALFPLLIVYCKKQKSTRDLRPHARVVFRDSGFKDDSVKINVEQIFKLMSPHTEVRTV